MKNLLVPKKLNLRQFCALALLTAITVVLAVFCTIRVGSAIKIPLKFISVFLTAVIFGPWYAGLSAALGDILNLLLAPSGAPPLPLLTLLEFVNGFIFGLFFYTKTQKSYFLRALICTALLFLSDMFLTTAVLNHVGILPTFWVGFSTRIIAGIIKWALQFAVLLLFKKHAPRLKKIMQK